MIKSIKVNNIQYNVAQASAVDQKTLLSIVGGRLAVNAANSDTKQIDAVFLTGALLGIDESTLDKIAGIVLYKTVINGDDRLVTVDDFQGCILSYYTLIAEAIKINLQDFLAWLDSLRSKAENSEKKEKAAA